MHPDHVHNLEIKLQTCALFSCKVCDKYLITEQQIRFCSNIEDFFIDIWWISFSSDFEALYQNHFKCLTGSALHHITFSNIKRLISKRKLSSQIQLYTYASECSRDLFTCELRTCWHFQTSPENGIKTVPLPFKISFKTCAFKLRLWLPVVSLQLLYLVHACSQCKNISPSQFWNRLWWC